MAENLTGYVERSGKTQKELAAIVGVSPSTLSDWMKGKKYPRIDKIERLASFFGITKSDLIEEKHAEKQRAAQTGLPTGIPIDEDLRNMIEEYNMLGSKQQKSVRDLIHSLATPED